MFFYWVRVTAPAGNNTFTITTGNFNTVFDIANGSNVFDNSRHPSITQNSGRTTVTANAPAAGTYFIAIKYNTGGVPDAVPTHNCV